MTPLSENSIVLKKLLTWSAKLFSWKKQESDASNNEREIKASPDFAGNYQGPLYAPHPDIKKSK